MVKKIIATYHHSFAGGSKNTSRLLHYLSQNGCEVNAFFFEKPQFFEYTNTQIKIDICNASNLHSDVIDSSYIKNYSLANKIVKALETKQDAILLGANLFPYCNLLLEAKSQLRGLTDSGPKLILHPVGSDIWQIGPHIKSRVKWLLDHPLTNLVFTYSKSFADDIKNYYNIKREIHVLSPILESERFHLITEKEGLQRRNLLNFKDEYFIMHHHSSMRRIKCPTIVLDIGMKAAQLIKRKCILIISGPIPFDDIASMNLTMSRIDDGGMFSYKSESPNLTIYWTGLLQNVEYTLQISDVEINASLNDSYNLAIMEAMACGVPVVTSSVAGVCEDVKRSEGGYCFPTQKLTFDELNNLLDSSNPKKHLFDIDCAISAILDLSENKHKSKIMGEKGAAYTKAHFSPEKVTAKFHKLLES